MKKPDNMTEVQWQDWQENGLGPCGVLVGQDYCGKPAWTTITDIKEMTKPEDEVINYKIINHHLACPKHERKQVYINANGTVTSGKSSYELIRSYIDGKVNGNK